MEPSDAWSAVEADPTDPPWSGIRLGAARDGALRAVVPGEPRRCRLDLTRGTPTARDVHSARWQLVALDAEMAQVIPPTDPTGAPSRHVVLHEVAELRELLAQRERVAS